MKKPKFTWSEKNSVGYIILKPKGEICSTSSYHKGEFIVNFDMSENGELLGIEILKIKKSK
jgi:hypothetical protein